MSGSREFTWVSGLRGPEPQIMVNPPVGAVGRVLASIAIADDDKRSLAEFAAAYPAPTQKED